MNHSQELSEERKRDQYNDAIRVLIHAAYTLADQAGEAELMQGLNKIDHELMLKSNVHSSTDYNPDITSLIINYAVGQADYVNQNKVVPIEQIVRQYLEP